MQDIINPIDRALLKAELTKEKRLRSTNKSKNEIYIVTAHDSPNVMQEIRPGCGGKAAGAHHGRGNLLH